MTGLAQVCTQSIQNLESVPILRGKLEFLITFIEIAQFIKRESTREKASG